ERAQIAVRGGILDVFPTTGRDPVRIELFGDDVEAIRAFSPYTQRALGAIGSVRLYPAVEAAGAPDAGGEGGGAEGRGPSPPRAPDLVWRADAVREVWEEGGFDRELEGARIDPLPSGQELAFEAQRPALAARGLGEAERELVSLVHGGLRV